MITDNNTERELSTEPFGMVVPKYEYERELNLKIPNELWEDICDSWDEYDPIRLELQKIVDKRMMEFVKEKTIDYKNSLMNFNGSNLYGSPFGKVRRLYGGWGNLQVGFNLRGSVHTRNDIILGIYHEKQKKEFYRESDRYEGKQLWYRFTRLNPIEYKVEVFDTNDEGYLKSSNVWGGEIPQPLYTKTETWKTIQKWLRTFPDASKEIKQKFWTGLMTPKEFEYHIDFLKSEEEKHSKWCEELQNPTTLEGKKKKIVRLENDLPGLKKLIEKQHPESKSYSNMNKIYSETLSTISILKKEIV